MEQRLPFHLQLRLERERLGLSQEELAEHIGCSEKTITRWENGENVPQPHHRHRFSEFFGKSLEELGLTGLSSQPERADESANPLHKQDWGEAPRGNVFYGRQSERADLQTWMAQPHCRVVAIVGIGGIGKTSLTATTALQLQDAFTSIFWRSLHNAPPPHHFLQQCLQFLQPQSLPSSTDDLLLLLLRHLQDHRCLLVLDNFESLLQPGQSVGHYREGYEPYGRLLQLLGETEHQSCLLLTSREKPREIIQLEGKNSPVRSLALAGIGLHEGQELLQEKDLSGTSEDWAQLIQLYSGNPLALKLVAGSLQELFAGHIARFLQTQEIAFGDITDLLNRQFERLSSAERELLYWLAIEREALTLEELQANVVYPLTKGIATLSSLRRRFLIEQRDQDHFALQPVIQEYVTDEIIQHAYDEFGTPLSEIWSNYAFLKAQAKEYLRESQHRLILAPIVQCLQARYGQHGLEQKIHTLLADLRGIALSQNSYIGGNVLNLLLFSAADISAFDFSCLPIRQAYLQENSLSHVNFHGAHFRECVFTNTFGDILSLSFSPNGQVLAAGTSNGEVWLYSLQEQSLVGTLRGHTDGVWAVAFSPDGKLLASGSDDQTVRLWSLEAGASLQTLSGHRNRVRAVAFSPDGSMLASGGEDEIMHLWSLPDGGSLRTFVGHTGRIWSLVFSPDGGSLASGATDSTVRIWEVASGSCISILSEHTGWIRSVRFSPDGQLLASVSDDQTVQIWNWQQATSQQILRGHESPVWSLAFTPDSKTLITGSESGQVRFWDMDGKTCTQVIQGHHRGIRVLATDSTGHWLASGGEDESIHLWDLSTGVCIKRFCGYTNRVWQISNTASTNQLASCSEDGSIRFWDLSTGRCTQRFQHPAHCARCVAMQPDGRWLASGGEDHTVCLWDRTSGQCKYVLGGHRTWIRTITFSPDGLFLATGGEDGVISVWDMRDPTRANEQRIALHGHTSWIRSVAFAPHGDLLASGSDDQTIRLWDRKTGQCIKALHGHSGRVRTVTFHPDGKIMASGSEDGSIRLWDLLTWDCVTIFEGQRERILTLAFRADGNLLASGSNDATVHIWSLREQSWQDATTLAEHEGQVRSVCFHAHPPLLASASEDGTIKLWEIKDNPEVEATCINTLISGRPYEGMNITKAQGLTEAQKQSLLALGAINHESSSMESGYVVDLIKTYKGC